MRAYVDTSVLVAFLLEESSCAAVERFLLTRPELATSDLCRGELASAIARKVIGGEISAERGKGFVRQADAWQSRWLRADCLAEDFHRAHRYVLHFELKLRYPDALHIAIAERHSCTLVSLDKRQLAAAQALELTVLDPEAEPS